MTGKEITSALIVIGLMCCLIGGVFVYVFTHYFQGRNIESKTLIIPEKRLEAHGMTVDTIYIYKAPK